MHFAVLPPEVNSGGIYAGPGVSPMLTAASAWDELANELHWSADDFDAVVSGLTRDSWQGPAAASMGASERLRGFLERLRPGRTRLRTAG
jgi:PPE-repeat protein